MVKVYGLGGVMVGESCCLCGTKKAETCHLSAMYKIWCIIIGDTTPFSVEIDKTECVDALKQGIKKKAKPMLDAFDTHELTLYKIKDFELKGFDKHTVQEISQNLSEQTLLNPWIELSTIEDGFPKTGMLHILVEHPAGESIQ